MFVYFIRNKFYPRNKFIMHGSLYSLLVLSIQGHSSFSLNTFFFPYVSGPGGPSTFADNTEASFVSLPPYQYGSCHWCLALKSLARSPSLSLLCIVSPGRMGQLHHPRISVVQARYFLCLSIASYPSRGSILKISFLQKLLICGESGILHSVFLMQ